MGVDVELVANLKDRRLTDDELLSYSVKMCVAIGADNFFIGLSNNTDHAITRVGADSWHRETIVYQSDDNILAVNMSRRYWGPGYERGDWPVIHYTILWIQTVLDAREVWYGGDTGEALELVDDKMLVSYTNKYLAGDSMNYWMRRLGGSWVCPTCRIGTSNCGGGQGDTFLHCNGCGRNYIQFADGVVKTPKYRHMDFFKREEFTVIVDHQPPA
jgi:hypothetical protein